MEDMEFETPTNEEPHEESSQQIIETQIESSSMILLKNNPNLE